MSEKRDLPDKTCSICGKTYRESYDACAELKKMRELGCCFICALWEIHAERGCKTVINGWVYSPGRRTSGPFRGMAGRRFDIEYLADGRRITTYDLWCGGKIPERLRDRLPDTARFLNGASEAQVGEITCFRQSDTKTETYPLPTSEDAE